REKLFGADNVLVSPTLVSEAETLCRLHRAGEAIPLIQRAIDLAEKINPGGDQSYYLERLAEAERERGDFARALAEDERALSAHKSEDGWLARPLTGKGIDLIGLGRSKEAVAPLERALSLRANAIPADRAETQFALARALGKTARSLQLAESAK